MSVAWLWAQVAQTALCYEWVDYLAFQNAGRAARGPTARRWAVERASVIDDLEDALVIAGIVLGSSYTAEMDCARDEALLHKPFELAGQVPIAVRLQSAASALAERP